MLAVEQPPPRGLTKSSRAGEAVAELRADLAAEFALGIRQQGSFAIHPPDPLRSAHRIRTGTPWTCAGSARGAVAHPSLETAQVEGLGVTTTRSLSSSAATRWLMYSLPLSAWKPRTGNGNDSRSPSRSGSRARIVEVALRAALQVGAPRVRREALPTQVLVVRLREGERAAVPVPGVHAALGQRPVVRRDAPRLRVRPRHAAARPLKWPVVATRGSRLPPNRARRPNRPSLGGAVRRQDCDPDSAPDRQNEGCRESGVKSEAGWAKRKGPAPRGNQTSHWPTGSAARTRSA